MTERWGDNFKTPCMVIQPVCIFQCLSNLIIPRKKYCTTTYSKYTPRSISRVILRVSRLKMLHERASELYPSFLSISFFEYLEGYLCQTKIKRNRVMRPLVFYELNQLLVFLTEEAIVGLRLEDLLGSVEQEAERQEDLHVGALLEDTLIDVSGILQLIHANCILARSVANSIQGIQNLKKRIFSLDQNNDNERLRLYHFKK